MKRIIGIGAGIGLLIAIWLLAVYLIGSGVEAGLRRQMDRVPLPAGYEIELSDYQRGFFGARAQLALHFPPHPIISEAEPTEPVVLTVPLALDHGPILGGGILFGRFSGRTDLRSAELNGEPFGTLIDADGSLTLAQGFAGNWSMDLELTGEGGALDNARWEPFEIRGSGWADAERFELTSEIPHLAASGTSGVDFQLSAFTAGAKGEIAVAALYGGATDPVEDGAQLTATVGWDRLLIDRTGASGDTPAYLATGQARLETVGEAAFGAPILGRQGYVIEDFETRGAGLDFSLARFAVTYSAEQGETQEDLALAVDLAIDRLATSGAFALSVDRFRFPAELTGLDAKALADYSRAGLKQNADLYGKLFTGAGPKDAVTEIESASDAALMRLMERLVETGATLRIEDAVADTSLGAAGLTGFAALPPGDTAAQELAAAVPTLKAEARLTLSAQMVETTAAQQLALAGAITDQMGQEEVQTLIDQQIALFVTQGFVVEDEDGSFYIEAKVEDGLLSMNGRPIRDLTTPQ